MLGKLVLAALALATLAGPISPAIAQASYGDEVSYLRSIGRSMAMAGLGDMLQTVSDSQVLVLGYTFCSALDSGMTMEELTLTNIQSAAQQSNPQVGSALLALDSFSIGAASTYLCPWHSDKVKAFNAQRVSPPNP